MNYLAHAYLSFDIPAITVGNLISDFVKGKKKWEYPPEVQQGIALHRAIDTFTDTHPVTQQAKTFFRSAYGLYAGALIDVVYDHFLATDPGEFRPDGLTAFAGRTYEAVGVWEPIFPERFTRMFFYMRTQDWLSNYQYKEGIFNSFAGLARRARYMAGPEEAGRLFEAHYTALGDCYREFFPSLKNYARDWLDRQPPVAPS